MSMSTNMDDCPCSGKNMRHLIRSKECLWRWIQTLNLQLTLMARFFDKVRKAFPSAHLPQVQL